MGTGKERVSVEALATRLEALRGWRNRRRDAGIAEAVEGVVREARSEDRRGRALEALGGVWESIAPPDVARVCEPASQARGVLVLACADRGAGFLVDRWLRSGGEAALRRACRVHVRKVRWEVVG